MSTNKSKKLYQRSAKQADKIFWITVVTAVLSLLVVVLLANTETNRLIIWIIGGLVVYHAVRRVVKGPPVGVAMLELANDVLIFRNASSRPPKVDRIVLDKIHSIRLMGEKQLRYFDCKLMTGDIKRIGPFERGQGEMVIAEWFYDALPETPFMVDTSATPMAQVEERPPGL